MSATQPTLQTIASFKVCGYQVTTCNNSEFNPDTAQLPTLWQQFSQSDLAKASPCFGVYSHYESDANGKYQVTVGSRDDDTHPDLASITILAGKYLVFQNRGPMPAAVIETWQQIWDYFAKDPAYERNFQSDFEAYYSADEVAIHIGVFG